MTTSVNSHSSNTHIHKHAHAPARPFSSEEQNSFLKQYDFLVLVDRSGSMKTVEDAADKITRWDIVKEQLKIIVDTATEYDSNGIDICFFGSETEWVEGVESEDRVTELFNKYKPSGCTNMARALNEAFDHHFACKESKLDQKTIILVITDGIPDNGHDIEASKKEVVNSIVKTTNKLAKDTLFKFKSPDGKTSRKTLEIGIRIFQVGADPSATRYLTNLDDHLTEAKADIVDTGNIEELTNKASVKNAFINAIFD